MVVVHHISSNKCPGAYLNFWLKGGALIGRRALNRGEALFLSMNCNFILDISLIEKPKLQHYPCNASQ